MSDSYFTEKLLRDPYYSSAYAHYHSVDMMIRAGFLAVKPPTTTVDEKTSPYIWHTTPFQKIVINLKKVAIHIPGSAQKVSILVTTGAFLPIHNGHLQMMDAAKKELEARGQIVVGGYLSPSHDKYVITKSKPSHMIYVAQRLQMCQSAIAKSDWLMVDPWEARFNSVPINFTEVLEHLRIYLQQVLPHFVFNLVYVFGSDNAKFAHAFFRHGACVCIPRKGYESKMQEEISINPNLVHNSHIIFSSKTLPSAAASSSAIRKGHTNYAPEAIKSLITQWKQSKILGPSKGKPEKYLVRDDRDWILNLWKDHWAFETLDDQLDIFFESFLQNLLTALNSNRDKRNIPVTTIKFNKLSNQTKTALQLMGKYSTINVDPCTPGTYKIKISRWFGLSDGQHQVIKVGHRPFSDDISLQWAQIPSGKYVLLDDDSYSGYTLQELLTTKPQRIEVSHVETLETRDTDPHLKGSLSTRDILDFRDVVAGSQDGGLVVPLPDGSLARAPYLLPYVSLVNRASIPSSQERWLSLKLWTLNATFYKAVPSLTLKQTDPGFQALMTYVGFAPDAGLYEISLWHLNQLLNTTHQEY